MRQLLKYCRISDGAGFHAYSTTESQHHMRKTMANILIIDDDPHIRDMLTELLEDEGYTVTSVSNGQEAIAYLQYSGQPPCVILLDLMMPVMNGWQFRNVQQQDPSLASIPVVVLSAVEDIQKETAAIGADALIAKPVNLDALLETVGNYCA